MDVVCLHGFGFPRGRGDIMHYADTIGEGNIYEKVLGWYEQKGGHWRPASLLERLAREDRSFTEIEV